MDIEKTEKQAEKWQRFLNEIVGVLAFNFALGSMSMPNAPASFIASLLSFAILEKLITSKSWKFPSEITKLRNKQDRSIIEEAELAYAIHKYLNNGNYSIYKIGTFSLGAVFLYSLIKIPFYLAGAT